MRNSALIAVLMCFLTACAYTPHDVNLLLDQPEVTDATVGEGVALRLRVLDERDETDLGNRGAGIAVAEVTASNIMSEFTRVVTNGFMAKGYSLTDDPTAADARIDVALRSLKFDETSGFFTVGANVATTILVDAERGDLDYKNAYRYTDEERQFAVSTGSGIDDSINAALNSAVVKLFDDRELDSFLTSE